MKGSFVWACALIIASGYVYNEWHKWGILQRSADSHIVTNEQLVEFVSKGDRFTASDGVRLCEVLSADDVDCRALFRK